MVTIKTAVRNSFRFPGGSATFAGGGTFGSSVKVQYNGSDRTILAPTGENTFYKNTATDSIIARFGNQNGAENIVLNAGGSADFKGAVEVGNNTLL